MRAGRRFGAVVAALVAVILLAPPRTAAAGPGGGTPLEVEAVPVEFAPFEPSRTRFGRLEWRGGVELSAQDDRFGGFSGLVLSRDATRLIAVSDLGWWLEGRLGYRSGRVASFTGARMGRLLDASGRPFRGKRLQDAESLAADGETVDGDLLVAFERTSRILRYPYGRSGMAARPERVRTPPAIEAGPNNKELEAVGRFAGDGPMEGALVAVSERQLDADGNILGWVFGAGRPRTLRFRRVRDFDVTDLAIDRQSQALFTLERRFSPFSGLGMLIRRFDAAALRGPGPLEGEVLFEANQTLAIDNMEGLAATRTKDGEILLTILSDDNYNGFQRTLLLQFAVK